MLSPEDVVQQLSSKRSTITEAEVRKAIQDATTEQTKPDEAAPLATNIELNTAMRYFKVTRQA
jgi:hypothetical protein